MNQIDRCLLKVLYVLLIAGTMGLNLEGQLETASADSENPQVLEIKYDALKALVLEKNGRVKAARLDQSAARQRQGAFFFRSFFPRASIFGAQEAFSIDDAKIKTEPTYGIEFTSQLFNGGHDLIESKVRDLETEKRELIYRKVVAEEVLEARDLFWDMLSLQKRISLLKEMLATNAKNLQSALKRIRSGVATASDKFEFEMKEVDLKRDLSKSEMSFRQKQAQFQQVLGLELRTQLKLVQKFEHNHDFSDVLNPGPKLREYLYQDGLIEAEQRDLLSQQEDRSLLPKLEAFAGYKRYNEREEEDTPFGPGKKDEGVAGLRLVLDIDNLFATRSESHALKSEAVAQRERARYLKDVTNINIKNDFEEIRFLDELVHDAEENITRAKKYYELTLSEYVRGVKNSPDVLGASEKLFEREFNLIEIIRDFQKVRARILVTQEK